MKPAKSKLHLLTRHFKHWQKDRTFLKDTEAPSKLFDSDGRLHETNANILEAFYAVSLAIAKKKETSHYRRDVDKAMSEKMIEIVLGKEAKKKIAAISLLNSGGYWVRRTRQPPQAPSFKNGVCSFRLFCGILK